MKYDEVDFLEQFDSKEQDNDFPEWEKYILKNYENTIEITLKYYEDEVYFLVNNIVGFTLFDVELIRCDKNKPGLIRFLFFRKNKKIANTILTVKPYIFLSIDSD